MMKRPLLAAALLGAVTLAVGTLAPSAGAAPRRPGVSFGAARITPRRVGGSGGPVSLSIRITARGTGINSASARATIRGAGAASGPTATLLGNGSVYTGSVTIPFNPSRRATQADFFVTVTTDRGTFSKRVGQVTINGSDVDPNGPPPPPPI